MTFIVQHARRRQDDGRRPFAGDAAHNCNLSSADARVGGGSSSGSRGNRTFSAAAEHVDGA